MAAASLTMNERFVASMVLGGVGDAIGFYNEKWEFNFCGKDIHKECDKLGGVKKLKVKCKCSNLLNAVVGGQV